MKEGCNMHEALRKLLNIIYIMLGIIIFLLVIF